MGYACPVCGDPQADAGHLANHLAFTAMTSGDDHEEWLDERVPGWGQLGEAELAAEVVEHADEAEYPQVFEASGVEDGHGHGHDHSQGGGVDLGRARERGSAETDADTRAILEEARELSPDPTESAERERDSDDGASGAADADEHANADADEHADDDRDGDETE